MSHWNKSLVFTDADIMTNNDQHQHKRKDRDNDDEYNENKNNKKRKIKEQTQTEHPRRSARLANKRKLDETKISEFKNYYFKKSAESNLNSHDNMDVDEEKFFSKNKMKIDEKI